MSSEEPLTAQLRRAGEQDRTERKAWTNIVQEELRGDAQSAATSFGAETLARSPLSQWFPGQQWRIVAAVRREWGDRDAYTEWHPYTSAPGGVPPPHGSSSSPPKTLRLRPGAARTLTSSCEMNRVPSLSRPWILEEATHRAHGCPTGPRTPGGGWRRNLTCPGRRALLHRRTR